jgi:hypothetical protein
MFDKHGMKTLEDFSETMYRQYGVRVAILGGYRDRDSELSIMLCVLNAIYCARGLTTRHIAMTTIKS